MLVTLEKFGKVERPAVTSLDVAETFGKRHDHVLRDVKELGCSEEFRLPNFGETYYLDAQGRKQRMVVMTRDGFTLLAMGYTGDLAMKFKEAYIRQFNAMESALLGKRIEREKGVAVRQALTKALQQSAENERMHGHAYSNYTNCIYKVLFGKNAAQLRDEFNIEKTDSLRDCFTSDQIKSFIENTNAKRLSA